MTLAARMREILSRAGTGQLYQTHTLDGEELNHGVRGIERRALVRLDDFQGKRVLDLGCASGSETLWAAEMGATYALGIDFVPTYLVALTELAAAWNENHASSRDDVPGASVVYVEGGADSPYTAETLAENRWRAEFLGRTPGNRYDPRPLRPLFRLERL